jgi:hypothetical protein
MKTTSELKKDYMAMDEGAREILTAVFTSGARFKSDEEAWSAIAEQHNILDQVETLMSSVKPGYKSPDLDADEIAKVAVENPTASRHEIEEEVKAKAPKAGTFGNRSEEELAEAIYGPGRH